MNNADVLDYLSVKAEELEVNEIDSDVYMVRLILFVLLPLGATRAR